MGGERAVCRPLEEQGRVIERRHEALPPPPSPPLTTVHALEAKATAYDPAAHETQLLAAVEPGCSPNVPGAHAVHELALVWATGTTWYVPVGQGVHCVAAAAA